MLADHPKNIYLAERILLTPVNTWLSSLFDEEHRLHTVEVMAGSTLSAIDSVLAQQARSRVSTAETHLRRLQDAIKAGANPAALVDALNQAHEERTAAKALLKGLPTTTIMDRAAIEALVDHLGGLTQALQRATGEYLKRLYSDLGLSMTYDPAYNAVEVTIKPSLVGIARVSEERVAH